MTPQSHKPDYIIRKRRSGNWYWATTLVIFAALAAAAGFGYWMNQKQYDFSETAQEQFEQVQASLNEANSSAVRWQQQYQLEKSINEELRKHTFELELKLYNRNKEVEAFQRIFDPDSVESGIQIANISWEKNASNRYQYRLILIQAKQQKLAISGQYELALIGKINDEVQEINLNELESLKDSDRKFRFKYMEVRNGQFELPKGFEPQSIRVSVKTSGRNGKSIVQEFEWDQSKNVANDKDNNNQEQATTEQESSGGIE